MTIDYKEMDRDETIEFLYRCLAWPKKIVDDDTIIQKYVPFERDFQQRVEKVKEKYARYYSEKCLPAD
jgi:hypothetical protein